MPAPSITVVGTGDVGSALVELLAAGGHRVVVGTRRPDRLAGTLRELADAGAITVRSVATCAAGADVVLLAVPWHAAADTVREAAPADGTVVVDTTNFNRARDGGGTDPGPGGTTERLAAAFPGPTWVKSFNMLWAGFLRADADRDAPHRVVLVAADDPVAKRAVAGLIGDMGFVPFDTGALADAAERQLEGTPAWNERLTAAEAAALLPGAPGRVG